MTPRYSVRMMQPACRPSAKLLMSSDKTIELAGPRPERDAGVPHFRLACVRCGGAVRPGQLRCSRCRDGEGEHLPGGDAHVTVGPDSNHVSRPGAAYQFSIESLLLLTTVAAGCLAVVAAMPILGMFASLIALAAFMRTSIAGRLRLAAGRPFALVNKLVTFFLSCLVVIIAATIAAMMLAGLTMVAGAALRVPWDFRTNTASGLVAYYFVGTFCWICVVVVPLTPAGWFLWATRPR